jgi:hypothetical protein
MYLVKKSFTKVNNVKDCRMKNYGTGQTPRLICQTNAAKIKRTIKILIINFIFFILIVFCNYSVYEVHFIIPGA